MYHLVSVGFRDVCSYDIAIRNHACWCNMAKSFSLFQYFFTAYPWRSTLTLLALSASALAEGVGIAMLFPLIGLVVDVEGTGGTLTTYVERVFAFIGLDLSLAGLLVMIVVAISLKSMLMLLAMTQVGYSAAHVAMDLRLAFIRALLEARWTHFVDWRPGEMASAISVEPARTATAYVSCCRVLSGGIQLLVYLGLSIAISWEILLAALVVSALGMVVLSRLVRISHRAGQSQTRLQKSLMTRLLQALDGFKPLKAMALERSTKSLIEGDIRRLNHALRMIVVSREALTESHEVIRTFAVAGGLYVFGAVWRQPVEGLLVLALIFMRTLQKLSLLQSYYQTVMANQPAFASVRSTIAAAERAREASVGGKTPRFSTAISLREVWFSYGRGTVLESVSMTLPVRSFIAIIGSSGVGKTTVADLIIGLLRPQRGEIWIDDLPMRDIDTRAWRGMIGYVPQEILLFHDTVIANVALGQSGIYRAKVETALRRAEAWEFIAALPDGMDTVIGERGARLSGGQRQRIGIARALVREPALLILDEATTALDPETEAGIVATVRRLASSLSVLSISHQPAMQRAADLVYRLHDGTATLERADGERTRGQVADLHSLA